MHTRLTLLATLAAAIAFALVMLAAPATSLAAGPCNWAGTVSDDWHNGGNWGGNCNGGSGLPGSADDVHILAVARLPRVSAAATIHGLALDAGALLTLANHANITLAGESTFSGTLRSQPGSQLRFAPDSAGATIRFLNPTTFSGTLQLAGTMVNPTLVMANNGLLTIAASGTLQVGVTAPNKPWTMQGRLDNQGEMDINKDFTLSAPSAVHTNTGSIVLNSGDMLIDLSSGSSSFTNQGAITVAASLTLTVNGGTFHHAGGAINGAGNALFDQTTLDLSSPYSNTLPTLTLNRSVVQGSANIANIGDQTLRAISTTIQTSVDNAGIFIVQRSTSVAGHFTTHPGSTLRLESGTANAAAQMRVNETVTNLGILAISSTTGVSTTQYLFSTPRLTNTSGATVVVALWQAQAAFDTTLVNQGTFNVGGATVLSPTNALHTNSGTINLNSGYLDATRGDLVNSGTLNYAGTSLPAASMNGPDAPAQPHGSIWVGSRSTTNNPGGTINIGAGAGTLAPTPLSINRYWMDTRLNNLGTINVAAEFTVTQASATHTNSGSINLKGGLIDFVEELTNKGTITIAGTAALNAANAPAQPSGSFWVGSRKLTNDPGGNIVANTTGFLWTQLVNNGTLSVGAPLTVEVRPDVCNPCGFATLSGNGTTNVAAPLSVVGDVQNGGTMNFGPATQNANAPSKSAAAGLYDMIDPQNKLINLPGGTLNILASATSGASIRSRISNQGALNVAAPLTVSVDACNPCAYTILTNTGSISINEGALSIGGDLDNHGAMLITQLITVFDFAVRTRNLTNAAGGTINVGGTGAQAAAAGPQQPAPRGRGIWIQANVMTNQPGGTLNVLPAATTGVSITGLLNNQGAMNVSAPVTHNNQDVCNPCDYVILTNTGSISLNTTNLTVAGDALNNGSVVIGPAAASVTKPAQPQPNTSGWIIAGRTTNGGSGNLIVNGPATLDTQLLNQGNMAINAPLTMPKAGSVHTNTGSINVQSTVSVTSDFNNLGTLTFGPAALLNAPAQPQPEATNWIIAGRTTNGGSGNFIVNGPTTFGGPLVNQGSMTINATQFTFDTSLFITYLSNSGNVSITNGASLNLPGNYTQTTGTTTLNGSAAISNVLLSGGTLKGGGTLTGNLTNGGVLAAGNSPGALTIAGNYTQLPGGALNVEIGGLTAGTQYDTLTVTGAATLSGTLNLSLVNAFVPANGNAFTFLNAGSRSGSFTAVNGALLAGGKRLGVVYGSTFARAVALGQSLFLPLVVR